MNLQSFKNGIARMAFGMTTSEAHEKGVCISCKQNVDRTTLAPDDAKEYRMSGLCPGCFEEITREEDEPDGPDAS